MASSNSMKVDIAMDASQLVSGVRQATSALQEVSQQVSNTDNSFKSIRTEINKQQAEVNKLTNAYMQMKQQYGESAAVTEDYKTKLAESVQSLAQLKAEQEQVATAVRQATQAIIGEGQGIQQASNQIMSVSQRFDEIKNSGEPLKLQLKELKGLLAEMNFNGQGMSEEFNEIAQYAGKVRDAISDANTATNVFANDTQNLQAVIQAVQLVTAGFSAVKGTMTMLGIENKNFEKTLVKIQGAMLTLNALQKIEILLNKNSILIQKLQVTWYKIKDAVIKAQTISYRANTVAEAANTVGTKISTIVQTAWNVAKAVAKALLGDFTGLLIVGAGAMMTYALCTSDSTEETEKQSESVQNNTGIIDVNTEAIKRNKEMQSDWGKTVADNVAEQLSKYYLLQAKWKECNGDVKLQGKFLNDYASDIKSVTGRMLDLISAEDVFVKKTNDVVRAIMLRAEAEAGKELYKESVKTRLEHDYNGSRANGRYYTTYHEGDRFSKEEAEELSKKAGLSFYHNQDLVNRGGFYRLSKSGADKMNEYSKQQAAKLRQIDYDAENYWKDFYLKKEKEAEEAAKKAGINPGGHAGDGGNHRVHGTGGGHHSSNTGGSNTKKTEEKKPVEKSLGWMRQELQKLQNDLTNGFIPEDKITETKEKIDYLKKDIEKKEIELGFKTTPIEGSLEWLEKQVNKLKNDLKSGLIPDDKVDETENEIDDLTKRINAKKIQLGFEKAPITDYEKRIDGYLQYIKDTEEATRKYEQSKIELDKQLADADTALAQQLRDGLITQEQYNEQSEKLWNDYADKIGNLPSVLVYNKPNTSLDNIARHIQDLINDIQTQLDENDLDVDARIELMTKKQDLEKQLDELTHGKLSIPAVIEPEYIQTGSTTDLRKSYENATTQINQIMQDYENGIIKTTKERNAQVNELQRQLTELGLKPVVIELKTKGMEVMDKIGEKFNQFKNITGSLNGVKSLVTSIQEGADAWTIFTNALDASISIIETVNMIMGIFNTLKQAGTVATKESTAEKEKEVAASESVTAANVSETTSNLTEAGSEGAKAAGKAASQNAGMGPWGWIAGIAAAIAVAGAIFGIISQAKGYATGGIVTGNSTVGDKLYARLNGGEMVLNNRQQQHLMNIVNGAPLNSNATHLTTAEVKIRGNDLYAVLNNTAKTKSLVGKNIGIR